MESFAKVANIFRLLTIFAEHFAFHDRQSPKSALSYCNFLVFYGYLLLLLLLYQYFIAISYLFRPTTISSEQHEPCTEVVVLTLRG